MTQPEGSTARTEAPAAEPIALKERIRYLEAALREVVRLSGKSWVVHSFASDAILGKWGGRSTDRWTE